MMSFLKSGITEGAHGGRGCKRAAVFGRSSFFSLSPLSKPLEGSNEKTPVTGNQLSKKSKCKSATWQSNSGSASIFVGFCH